jgi:hypothetical protein
MDNPSSSSVRLPCSARGLVALSVAALALSVALFLVVESASGNSARVLGQVKGGTPPPSCPTPDKDRFPSRKLCLTYASVTGFQAVANGRRGVFKAPANGSIVAWSVDLSKPNKDERQTFTDLFDGGPSAQLAVLRKTKGNKFKLTKQSPRVSLDGSYGERPIFTLNKPLRVRKGVVIGLTTRTWVPNFAHDGRLGSNSDRWRASRGPKRCGNDPRKSDQQNRNDLLNSRPHQKQGSTRVYGCTYGNARVLYRAWFVPQKSGD